MNEDSHSCVEFTPCQYIKIYFSRLPKSTDKLDVLCILQMGAVNWQNKTNNCSTN